VDDKNERIKTRTHIRKNIHFFSFYERSVFLLLVFVLYLPLPISQPLSNLAILLLKGKKGLDKKNNFVKHELAKKEKLKLSNSGAIRTLEFEVE
jgi:predicted Co/Zn/Cd cation transporter (cation efflux family)